MSERLTVRVAPSFFEDLDRQLGSERGPNGEPSTIDFQSVELIAIVDEFATRFDSLLRPVAGRDDYRLLIKSGVLVLGISVVGQLMPDGAVELLRLELDLRTGWE